MQKDVAEHCDIEPATTKPCAGYIGKNGFIVRKTMEGNRRAGSILITEKGQEVVEKWVGALSRGGGFHADRIYGGGDGAVWRFLSRAYKNMSGKEAR